MSRPMRRKVDGAGTFGQIYNGDLTKSIATRQPRFSSMVFLRRRVVARNSQIGSRATA